jgi:hypothetical protein
VAIALIVGGATLTSCQVGARPYRPDFIGDLRLVGGDFWETTLVDVSVPYDPSRPIRVGDLTVAGGVRVTGLRPLPRSVVDDLAARERDGGIGGVSVPVAPLPPLTLPDNGRPAVGRMTITAQIRVSASSVDQAQRRVRNATVALVNEPDGQVVRLIAPGAAGYLDRVNYEITVDHPTPLTVRTRAGDVVVTRMAGDLDLVTREGDIDVDVHGALGLAGTFVRAISQAGDVRVDAASDTIMVIAERGKATVDWSLGRQPRVLDVVSLERPQLPATTRYTPNVRVTIRDDEVRAQWQDAVREAWVDAGLRGSAGE